MAAAEPAPAPAPAVAAGRSNLASRVVVGLFLAVLAVGDIWVGGIAFALMIALGVAIIYWEWSVMQGVSAGWRVGGVLLLAAVSALAHLGRPLEALALLGAAIIPVILTMWAARATSPKRWASTGLLYAGLPSISLIWLRQQPDGFALVMWTMALVWATDIFAYFAGRSIGGPKIWPAISPNKTWAGLLGGMAAAGLFSALFAWGAGWPQHWLPMLLLGAALAVVAQAGDFFESWLKRRAGVKDSGTLLPGHGGLMDRVDGLVPVACLVALWASLQPPVQLVAAGVPA